MAQSSNSNDNAPYRKDSVLPSFRILQTDSSTWFTKSQLPKSEFTIIIYFSPDCGHCQYEAKEIVKNIDSLKNTFMLWVSYKSISEIREFYHTYGLDKLPNLRIGRDPLYALPSFYQVRFTPFVAVYDSKGIFVKAYDKGVEMVELNALLRESKK
jgi:hypothetical protein